MRTLRCLMLNVRMSPAEMAELETEASRQGMTVAAVVRTALRRYANASASAYASDAAYAAAYRAALRSDAARELETPCEGAHRP